MYQADQLDAEPGELRLEFGKGAELGGAGRGEVILSHSVSIHIEYKY